MHWHKTVVFSEYLILVMSVPPNQTHKLFFCDRLIRERQSKTMKLFIHCVVLFLPYHA